MAVVDRIIPNVFHNLVQLMCLVGLEMKHSVEIGPKSLLTDLRWRRTWRWSSKALHAVSKKAKGSWSKVSTQKMDPLSISTRQYPLSR